MERGARLLAVLVGLTLGASAVGVGARTVEPGGDVRSMLDGYRADYPDMRFVHLRNVAELPRLKSVIEALGPRPTNLDYEHPPQLRETLLAAQLQRIAILLRERMPSSTLFASGDGPARARRFVCIVTLDESMLTDDRLASTRFLADGAVDEAGPVLDNRQFLGFTLDHEVFHCLDAYHNGPTRPRTFSELAACYGDLRAEQRADLFAAVAHRARERGGDGLLRTLAAFRTMTLVGWDVSHYTAPVLHAVLAMDPSFTHGLSSRSRAQAVMELADRLVVSPREHRRLVAASLEVSLLLGGGEAAFSSLYRELVEEGQEADPALVDELLAAVRGARRALSPARFAGSQPISR